jgi:hypothetical protein
MKRVLLVALAVLLAAGAAWAQFYEKLGADERKSLAEAYYLVGRQYAEQGKKAKGGEFQQMAYNIYPQLNPADISQKAEPSAAQLILAGKAVRAEAGEEEAAAVELLLKSRFLRLVSAFLGEDAPTLLSMMDGSVWFTKQGTELTQEAIRADLESFFAKVDLSGGLAPSSIFDLDSLEVSPVQGAAASWGPTYALRIKARADFSDQLAFWETKQQYLFHPRDGEWLLFAVGSGLPPASWQPAPPPAPVAAAPAPDVVDQVKAVRAAFLAALQDFLAKKTAQAADYFERQILILRLNTSLTRQEMATTFEGYFEGSDFSGVTPGDVVDLNSIAVEPSQRFAAEHSGPLYRLSVKTRMDLSDKIPFWTRFQEYYFSSEEGGWRIFAIF